MIGTEGSEYTLCVYTPGTRTQTYPCVTHCVPYGHCTHFQGWIMNGRRKIMNGGPSFKSFEGLVLNYRDGINWFLFKWISHFREAQNCLEWLKWATGFLFWYKKIVMPKKKVFPARNLKNLPLKRREPKKKIKVFLSRQFCASLIIDEIRNNTSTIFQNFFWTVVKYKSSSCGIVKKKKLKVNILNPHSSSVTP